MTFCLEKSRIESFLISLHKQACFDYKIEKAATTKNVTIIEDCPLFSPMTVVNTYSKKSKNIISNKTYLDSDELADCSFSEKRFFF